jgi:hypothetical protein
MFNVVDIEEALSVADVEFFGDGGAVAPAKPTLTAPAAGNLPIGDSTTLSATSTDVDLTRIDWILDPSGAATVIGTDSASPYSQSWTTAGSAGAHTIVARAVRNGISTDSDPVSVTLIAYPAKPTLTAPSGNVTWFAGTSQTVSATSSDGDLTRIDWVLDPGGGESVVATDSSSPYSQSWTVAGTNAAHTLVARAVRNGIHTDSDPITLTITQTFSALIPSANVLQAAQADQGVTQVSNAVSNWADLSGNGKDFAQATGANKPAFQASWVNSKPAITLDGSAQFMDCPGLHLPAPGTTPTWIFAIIEQTTWTANEALFGSDSATNAHIIQQRTGTPQIAIFNTNVVCLNNGAALTVPSRLEALFKNSTTLDYLKLGATKVTTSGTSAGNTDGTSNGRRIGATGAGGKCNFKVAALIHCNAEPSQAVKDALDAAVTAFYAGGVAV